MFDLTLEQPAHSLPIKRINTVEEMARAVMWLSSDEVSSIAGADIDVTAGMLACDRPNTARLHAAYTTSYH